MEAIEEIEMQNITGGVSAWVGVAISAIVIFLSGVIEGITNPTRCGE